MCHPNTEQPSQLRSVFYLHNSLFILLVELSNIKINCQAFSFLALHFLRKLKFEIMTGITENTIATKVSFSSFKTSKEKIIFEIYTRKE